MGGITIFESFVLQLHPMRLQLESRVGKSVMEYIFPGRRERKKVGHHNSHSNDHPERNTIRSTTSHLFQNALVTHSDPSMLQRASAEVPRTPTRYSVDDNRLTPISETSKRLSAARSFSDLRLASRQNSVQKLDRLSPYIHVDRSSTTNVDEFGKANGSKAAPDLSLQAKTQDDAAEMKTRSSQNTFVLVNISRLVLLLSLFFHLSNDQFLA